MFLNLLTLSSCFNKRSSDIPESSESDLDLFRADHFQIVGHNKDLFKTFPSPKTSISSSKFHVFLNILN